MAAWIRSSFFIVLAVIVAIFFPISGRPAEWFSTATVVAVAVLFFLYGARLSTREALDGLTNWRLHATILAFTFVLFPLIGVALRPVGMSYNPELYMGVLYLTLVPSTVQSSVAFTSIARGNVAGAIVSASASNVLGVVVTPALVMLLMSQRSGGGSGVVIVRMCLVILRFSCCCRLFWGSSPVGGGAWRSLRRRRQRSW